MTTPTGQISFSQIAAEFGYPPNKNLGAYRVNQTIGDRSWPLDAGVPTSGQIKFSDLQGKTLNVVVDYSGTEESNVGADARYSNGEVVGGFKSLPSRLGTDTKKIHNLIRKTIGGSSVDGIALRTGTTWDASTVALNFIITSTGEIIGRGGDGGRGSGTNGYYSGYDPTPNGVQYGEDGFPALATSYPCSITIESGGRIQAGGGGGGGGGGGVCEPDDNPSDPVANGAGGGGGAGYPAGKGGGTTDGSGVSYNAEKGSDGSKYVAGSGGRGSSTHNVQGPRDCANGGGGGGGGGPTPGSFGYGGGRYPGAGGDCPADNGTDGSSTSGGRGGSGYACRRGNGYREGGPGGANGKSVIYSSGVTVNLTNNGTLFGSTGEGIF